MSIVTVAEQHDTSLVPEAKQISEKFQTALTQFSECHQLYDSSMLFTLEEIDRLGNDMHINLFHHLLTSL